MPVALVGATVHDPYTLTCSAEHICPGIDRMAEYLANGKVLRGFPFDAPAHRALAHHRQLYGVILRPQQYLARAPKVAELA